MITAHLLLATILSAAANGSQATDEFSSYADVSRDAKIDVKDAFDDEVGEVKYLDQGWSAAQSMRFYRLPQGSKLIPYLWFVSLEQSGSPAPFADPANMNRFRYLPLKPHKDHNPDGLPVGFVREPQPGDPLKTDWLGLTCAACHTAEIRHNKIAYRIDGGPAMADHDTFLSELTAAMKATLEGNAQFDRFAEKVLAGNLTPETKLKLKESLRAQYEFRKKYNERNLTTTPYGQGFQGRAAGSLYYILTGFTDFPRGRHGCLQLASCPLLKSVPSVSWREPLPSGSLSRNIWTLCFGRLLSISTNGICCSLRSSI